MKRDPSALAERLWDVLVVGGGIHGACVAWDAVLRGLAVCLVERSDFASGTSANSMKIVHGGLRYLQDGDYRRMREAIGERRALLRIAPHLVHPLPVLVPLRGRGLRGRAALRMALLVNDLVGLDRNAGLDPAHRLPGGRAVSRPECLRLAPGLDAAGVTGGAVFHDARVEDSERLVLAFLRSAAKAGAQLANHAAVTGLRRDRDGGLRAVVHDRLADERIAVRARIVVNAAGPWVDEVRALAGPGRAPVPAFARAFNVVTRPLFADHAVALSTPGESGDGALVRRGARYLFVVPWRGQSLVGTWYERHDGRSGDVHVTEADVVRLLRAVNRACPAASLRLEDVRLVHGGLLPLASTGGDGLLARRGRILDHADDGARGLLSVVGVKSTTARLMAERAVDHVLARLGRRGPASLTAVVPLHGAEAGAPAESSPSGAPAEAPASMTTAYGSARGEVLAHLRRGEDAADPVAVVGAQVRHAIRAEMARTLADVVFRRSGLGTAGDPGPALLDAAASAAAEELGWTLERRRAELEEVDGRFGVPR